MEDVFAVIQCAGWGKNTEDFNGEQDIVNGEGKQSSLPNFRFKGRNKHHNGCIMNVCVL